MKPPRAKIQTLMVIIAVLGLVLATPGWMQRRQERFHLLTESHRKAGDLLIERYKLPFKRVNYLSKEEMDKLLRDMGPEVSVAAELSLWHGQMMMKYNRAENRPWEPADEDPPKPTEPK